ncbi:hypothetical protein [Cryptosporangium sp. NPDC051539]
MSGCYDYDYSYDCNDNSYDYDCRPRRRHHRKHYNDCWDYNYCN